jgi:predicted metal-dependent hydrolase
MSAGQGDSPHFQMDLLNLDGGDENGCSPHSPRIRVSVRARRLSVRVYPDARVEVVVPPRVEALANLMGVPYSKVSIRRQRSRWGSCSVRGTISLNACLLFQRPEVVDYLIVHELMHVKHMNHSARFWQAVERHCPGWRVLDRELLQGWRHVPRWIFSEGQAS